MCEIYKICHNQSAVSHNACTAYLARCRSFTDFAVINGCQTGQIKGRGTVQCTENSIKDCRHSRRRSHRRRYHSHCALQSVRSLVRVFCVKYFLLHKNVWLHYMSYTSRVSFVHKTSLRANGYHISTAAMTRHEVRDDECLVTNNHSALYLPLMWRFHVWISRLSAVTDARYISKKHIFFT